MRRDAIHSISAALVLALAVGGCNGPATDPTAGNNNVELALVGVDDVQLFDVSTLSQTSDIVSAVVTINEIDAHVGSKWIPIVTTPSTVDLLKLDHTTLNTLGVGTLPSGHIKELRLVLDQIGDYVVLKGGTKKPLLVPDNGVVKVEGNIDADSCATGIVILDFDPRLKVIYDGRKIYELTCVSKIKTKELKGSCGGPDMAGGPDMTGGQHSQGADMSKASCSPSQVCPQGDVCESGQCVPDPCANVVCPVGDVCSAGACVPDPCHNVVCPSGEVCTNGVCGSTNPTNPPPADMAGGCNHH